ncbi:hypothetical protein EON81_22275 [bacterium]|nr:MAG: hypothetical protein EON81_22275 [bacterium]
MFQQTFLGPEPIAHAELGEVRELKGHGFAVIAVLAVLIFFQGLQPAFFTRPMEMSGQAARLMVTSASKPVWRDLSHEISTDGSLVRTSERTYPQIGAPVERGEILSPADLHPGRLPEAGEEHEGEVALARSEP